MVWLMYPYSTNGFSMSVQKLEQSQISWFLCDTPFLFLKRAYKISLQYKFDVTINQPYSCV